MSVMSNIGLITYVCSFRKYVAVIQSSIQSELLLLIW